MSVQSEIDRIGSNVASQTDLIGAIQRSLTGKTATDVVRYAAQSLSDGQKAQARANIDAVGEDDLVAALETITALPYGGSKEWLQANGDTTQLYQIGGYVWGYVEADGWVSTGAEFIVVLNTSQMTNTSGTPYLLRSGNTGTVYSYAEASGDVGIPVHTTKPTTANEGDVIAVGGRKYRASVTSTQVPNFTNVADTSSADWLPDTRLNSSGTTSCPGMVTTNFLDTASTSDVIRVANLNMENVSGIGQGAVTLYNNNKTVNSRAATRSSSQFVSEVDGIYTFSNVADNMWLRLCGVPTNGDENVIITINEEITYSTETTVTWTDIGVYTPPTNAGWQATDETYSVLDSLPNNTDVGTTAVYSVDGVLYSFAGGSDWMQISRYDAPTLIVDNELSETSINAVQNKVVTELLTEVSSKATNNETEIAAINDRITSIETGNDSFTIPSFWQDAVDECIATIKTRQVGKHCVTFPFFSDNHTRDGKTQYAGVMIAHIMKECGIPYCFFGGDAITSAVASTADSDAEFKAQAKAFSTAMSYIPDGKFCMALGNHEGYLKANSSIAGSTQVNYDRNQTYEIFMRNDGTAQYKHFGDDGTYYYVDDIVSKVRWIVLNTNGIGNTAIDSVQLSWFENTALKFNESGWDVVIISHVPITNHYEQSNITNNTAVITMVQNYMNGSDPYKADIIGWYSGHIHRDRIYTGVSVNDTDDTVSGNMGFKQVTITSDATNIAYEDATKHVLDNSDQSHAIDFITINKLTRHVYLTRLGIGENREYTY